MKRQAISISIKDLKKIEKQLRTEIKDMEKLEIVNKFDIEKIKFQLNIINYPTLNGSRQMYCSDTWEFEMLQEEKIDVEEEDVLE